MRSGIAPPRVALEEAVSSGVARLLAEAATIVAHACYASDAPAWTDELFGPARTLTSWRREADALARRVRRARGWWAPAIWRAVRPLDELLERPLGDWPSVEELVQRASADGDCGPVRLASVEAYVRAGRSRLATDICRRLLLAASEPERVWRAWAALGYLYLQDGDPDLAHAAFEAAAELDGCGVPALVEAFAGSLVEEDERAVRLAAARLELLASPGSPEFERAIALLAARSSADPIRIERWRRVIGSRPSAALAVLGALA